MNADAWLYTAARREPTRTIARGISGNIYKLRASCLALSRREQTRL